jgi:hypothetical protein
LNARVRQEGLNSNPHELVGLGKTQHSSKVARQPENLEKVSQVSSSVMGWFTDVDYKFIYQ